MGIQYCHSQSISVQMPCKYYCATKGTLTKYVVLAYVTFTLRSIKVSKNLILVLLLVLQRLQTVKEDKLNFKGFFLFHKENIKDLK